MPPRRPDDGLGRSGERRLTVRPDGTVAFEFFSRRPAQEVVTPATETLRTLADIRRELIEEAHASMVEPLVRRARPGRSDREFRDIYETMHRRFQSKCRDLYETLSAREQRALGLPDGYDKNSLSEKHVVLLGEEILRREKRTEPTDEILQEAKEDYDAEE